MRSFIMTLHNIVLLILIYEFGNTQATKHALHICQYDRLEIHNFEIKSE